MEYFSRIRHYFPLVVAAIRWRNEMHTQEKNIYKKKTLECFIRCY